MDNQNVDAQPASDSRAFAITMRVVAPITKLTERLQEAYLEHQKRLSHPVKQAA
jgi:hypothetical protein